MTKLLMKISVIIPTIGRKTLNEVLDSLLLNKKSVQSFLEIIVVYDGDLKILYSSDAKAPELKILKQVQDDKQVLYLETGKKMYAGGARNLGIEKAMGDVLVFLGDDTIPAPDFLQRLVIWHHDHPEPHEALLGQVLWADHLAGDRFHQWMSDNAQFDYGRLNKGRTPSWLHFYTSNISFKRALMKDERFSNQFKGWGFEDIEFGYRLAHHGMILHYDRELKVYHDDEQTLEGLVKRTKVARQNAWCLSNCIQSCGCCHGV